MSRATATALAAVLLGFATLYLGGCRGEPPDSDTPTDDTGVPSDLADTAPDTTSPPPRCVEGRSAECTCTDGRTGAQVCRADGTWGECVCDSNPRDAGRDAGDTHRDPGDTSVSDTSVADTDDAGPSDDESEFEKDVSLPIACDSDSSEVAVIDESIDDLQKTLNRSDKRIFCIKPGDYRDQGGKWGIFIKEDGAESEPRYLWYYNPDNPTDAHPWHMDDPEAKTGDKRVLLPRTQLRGSYWTVDRMRFANGLKVQKKASHNIINRSMFYRRDLDTTEGAVSVKLETAQHTTVQNNVIARSESGYDCGHGSGSVGVEIVGADYSTIVGNEIFDMYCEDLIQSAAYADNPQIEGTVIADNDLYLTAEYAGKKPVENAIDLKAGPAEPGSSSLDGIPKEEWTLIQNNRIWNWHGGGNTWQDRYGPEGPATVFHVSTTSGIRFNYNVVWDTAKHAHNVITNSQKSTKNHSFRVLDNVVWKAGVGFKPEGVKRSVYKRNVVVDTDKGWGRWDADPTGDVTVRHNVFINSDVDKPTHADRGNDVSANGFYQSAPFRGDHPNSIVRDSAAAAKHEDLTVETKQITGPETVTIPNGAVTPDSPHSDWFD